jgi:NADPH2:quinone reductase
MRAVRCHSFDGIKALSIGEAAEPALGEDDVLIEVHAASVSYMDYLMICGGYQLRPPSLLQIKHIRVSYTFRQI